MGTRRQQGRRHRVAFSAWLTEAGVGVIVGLCVWVEERVMQWEWIEPRATLLANKTQRQF